MGAMASQITSLVIEYSTVYSEEDQRKHQSSASLAFVRGIHRGPVTGLCAGNSPGTGEFPAQMASNAENISISWHYHAMPQNFVNPFTHWIVLIVPMVK